MPARNVEEEFDALKTDFGKLSADLMRLTEAVRDLTGQEAKDLLKKGRATLDGANRDIGEAAAALGARGRQGVDCVVHEVRERPLLSILVCLGLGLAIGKLIERRD